MSQAIEIERKFVVVNFHNRMIPARSTKASIVQTYLKSQNGTERRVRQIETQDVKTYVYTEKEDTVKAAERIEHEVEIPFSAYNKLLEERDESLAQIKKDRYSFLTSGLLFELDVYRTPISNLAVLEIELDHISTKIALPDGWKLEEVTGNKQYKNYSIAAGSITWSKVAL